MPIFPFQTVHAFNLLRNIALEQVQTPFVFLSDIDFLPMPNSSAVLQQAVEDLMQTGNQKTVRSNGLYTLSNNNVVTLLEIPGVGSSGL